MQLNCQCTRYAQEHRPPVDKLSIQLLCEALSVCLVHQLSGHSCSDSDGMCARSLNLLCQAAVEELRQRAAGALFCHLCGNTKPGFFEQDLRGVCKNPEIPMYLFSRVGVRAVHTFRRRRKGLCRTSSSQDSILQSRCVRPRLRSTDRGVVSS